MNNEDKEKVKNLKKKIEDLKKQQKVEEHTKKSFKKFLDKVEKSKPNEMGIVFLGKNGIGQLIHVPSKNGFYTIKGESYHEREDCVYRLPHGKGAMVVIKEKGLVPEGTKKWNEREVKEKYFELQSHVMKGIRHAERVRMGEKDPSDISIKKWVLIGLAAIVVVAVIMSYV